MTELTRSELSSLKKPTLVLHAFSDTLSDQGDFDSAITTDYRNLRLRDTRYGIDNCLPRGAYGVELIEQLTGNLHSEIAKANGEAGLVNRLLGRVHPNIKAAEKALGNSTIRVIANSAPRTKERKNGKNFYLALTENGVEIYATPLEVLSYVRDRVTGLFEIPNEGNPVFDGKKEQFRSSIIGRSSEYPDHLRRVDPSIIPEQEHNLEIAYVDEFGNIRLRARDNARVQEEAHKANGTGEIGLSVDGEQSSVRAHLVSCLDEIPEGEWGFYQNVADGTDPQGSGYFELVRKWESNNSRVNGHTSIGRPKIGSSIQIGRV